MRDYEYIYNAEFENVIFATQNGVITLAETISGDVNGDKSINNKDLGLLMQYVNGWDVTVNTNAADVNDDGTVNNKDYALLMQYVNGWNIALK